MKTYHLILLLSTCAGIAYGAVASYFWHHKIDLKWLAIANTPFQVALPFALFILSALFVVLLWSCVAKGGA